MKHTEKQVNEFIESLGIKIQSSINLTCKEMDIDTEDILYITVIGNGDFQSIIGNTDDPRLITEHLEIAIEKVNAGKPFSEIVKN